MTNRNFAEKQIKNDEFKNYKINLKYKLISIQSYTNEELLKKLYNRKEESDILYRKSKFEYF